MIGGEVFLLTMMECQVKPPKGPRQRRSRQRDRLNEALHGTCEAHPGLNWLGPAEEFTEFLSRASSSPPPSVASCEALFRGAVVTIVAIPRRLYSEGFSLRFLMEKAGSFLSEHAIVFISERDMRLVALGRYDRLTPYLEAALQLSDTSPTRASPVRRAIVH